jgi:putative CocE/NonD family hydrolase
VLVYSSAPLDRDTEITGPVTVHLWAQSSSPDTDFTAKLAVVQPDGKTVNLNNGIIRTPFRDSLSTPTPTSPDRPYEYQIHIWPTSYEFRAGDRIRLEISSSDYPQFAPNPNTGAPFGTDAATRIATQTILHDVQHPSSVTLPVIPE